MCASTHLWQRGSYWPQRHWNVTIVCSSACLWNGGLVSQVKAQSWCGIYAGVPQTARNASCHCCFCKPLSCNDNDETEVGGVLLSLRIIAAAMVHRLTWPLKQMFLFYSIFGSLRVNVNAGEQRAESKIHLPLSPPVITNSGFRFQERFCFTTLLWLDFKHFCSFPIAMTFSKIKISKSAAVVTKMCSVACNYPYLFMTCLWIKF